MDEKTRTTLKQMLKTVQSLARQIESVVGAEHVEPVAIPAEVTALVRERYANRICLACLQPLSPGEKDKRGDHVACYNTIRARIRRNEETEPGAIAKGMMLPENRKPGKKARLDAARSNTPEEIHRIATEEAATRRSKKKS